MATNYPYNTNIPFATHKPSVDQPNMLTNTNSTNSIIGTDHLSFGQATGVQTDGMHKVVHLANQLSDPAAVLTTTELYSKQITYNSTSDTALFARSGAGVITQLTAPASISITTNGYTLLPGGLLMQWGTVTGISTATHVQNNTSFNIPFPNNCFLVNTTPIPAAGGVTSLSTISVNTLSLTQFNWVYNKQTGSSYTEFSWIALGN